MVLRGKRTDMGTLHSRCGFTLVELLVAMVAGLLLLGGMYTLFRSSSEIFTSQEQLVAVRQDIRAALSMMSRHIRMAGLDPSRNASCAGFSRANATSLHLQYDQDGDGVCENDLDFKFVADENALKVQLAGAGGYQPFVYDITSCAFAFEMDDGTLTAIPGDLDDIRMVSVQLCGRFTGPYAEKYDAPRCLNATVRCRNLGI
jgi:prepilin-type N-terminal cleavage/methylation domain-containing protein